MGYEEALKKAWEDIALLTTEKRFSVRLLSDNYDVDAEKGAVFSLLCNISSKTHVSIIILHYLARRLKLNGLPQPSGEWVDFKELEGGEGYYPAFRKRTIDRILEKYGSDPDALPETADKLPHKKYESSDVGIIIEVMDGVPILITMNRADEEFGPDANILFDKTISSIFCTEDVVVLTEIVTHQL
jgi:hypothetical protein